MSKIAVIGIVGNSVFLPVERFHVGGETVEARSIHFEFGGKGFNQAVAAARCGAEVSFLAAVGREYGAEIAAFLDTEGIRHTLVKKEGSTAFAAIVTDKSGSNRVTVYQGAQLAAGDAAAFEDEIRTADILLLSNEVAEEVNEAALQIALRYGVKCILNPAPARKNSASFTDHVFLFTPNEHELAGIENKQNVLVTLGKKGCLLRETGETLPAVDKGAAVDTTGAGDTFNGVLAALLAAGRDLRAAAKAANAAAALAVTRRYAVSAIPKKEEIQKILTETER